MRNGFPTIWCLWLLCAGIPAAAQDSARAQESSYKLKKAAQKLQQSLEKEDDETIARQYEALARELSDKGEYAKAEEYLKKAQAIYTRLDKRSSLASVTREIAKLQESQQKIEPAISNYKSAAEISRSKVFEQANFNDANRLRSGTGLTERMNYFRNNASLFEKEGKKDEAADAYQQLAETQLQQKDTRGAVESYNKAIEVAGDEDITPISKELVKAYAADKQVDRAIKVSEGILHKAKEQRNNELQIDQLRELAHLHAQKDAARSEDLLLDAYRLALQSRNTLKARDCLRDLVAFYEERKEPQKGMQLYHDFISSLDSLVRADSALLDARAFELTEQRIQELEKEKRLQLALIRRTNLFNYFLLGSVAVMLLLLFLVIKSFYAIKIKNKKIALQSLRREMNPHFIFNSLNSVNQYIAEHNELEANKYLTSYSGLMRNIMEHSHKDLVPLTVELEQLRKYLELEHRRFRDQFDYRISVEEALDSDAVLVPNMLIQPHLENAVWHGLRYKEGKGLLRLRIVKQGNEMEISITDNGIGMAQSRALKTEHQKSHQSRGLTNTAERIALLNDLYKTRITMTMDTPEEGTGTRVRIRLPIIDKT